MPLKCKSKWMQGRLPFVGKTQEDGTVVGPVYGFEDPDVEPFLLATGFFVETDEEADIIITLDELDIDPDTTWAKGTPAEYGRACSRVLDGGNG